jgi:DNA-binding response OmpR family regulator
MSTRQAPPAVAGGPTADPARSAAVLVVDDEPGMRNFLAKALASRCALVETADDVESAEALRRRVHFDLMVVDIRLPGESGVEWVGSRGCARSRWTRT